VGIIYFNWWFIPQDKLQYLKIIIGLLIKTAKFAVSFEKNQLELIHGKSQISIKKNKG
jgi:hypothetical protein